MLTLKQMLKYELLAFRFIQITNFIMKCTEDQELTVIDNLDSMDISSSDLAHIDPDAVAIKLDSLPNEVLLHILGRS